MKNLLWPCIVLFVFSSCATIQPKNEAVLDLKMKAALYSSQASIANLSTLKDPLFKGIQANKCLLNWGLEVFKLKQKLMKSKTTKQRSMLWFRLGTCYTYVSKFEQSLFYYDLALGTKLLSKRSKSIIYFNMGQIFEGRNQSVMAKSFYETSKKSAGSLEPMKSFADLKIGILSYKANEFKISNTYFNRLRRKYPKSEYLNFMIGINYLHMNEKDLVRNKVMRKLDEKSFSMILLRMAVDADSKKNWKAIEADLSHLDLEFFPHIDLKKYLLKKIGS